MRRTRRLRTLGLIAGVLALGTATLLPAQAQPADPTEKETICHKPGTEDEETLQVPPQAVPAHLDHGDHEGPCGDEETADAIIDADGTASPESGDPDARDVAVGDPLATFPVESVNDSGLDAFDQDGDGEWTLGPDGDDLHAEGPAFCDTAERDSEHDLGQDCKVLDTNGDLADGQPVDCDLEVAFDFTGSFNECPPTGVTYHDANDNGAWDDGEDIVLDTNGNLIFD